MHSSGSGSRLNRYLSLEWPIFPVNARSKAPYIQGGFHAASRDPAIIAGWFQRWPAAVAATPTGQAYRHVALDVDVKRGISGFDALEELSPGGLPDTAIALTPSGGVHLHFTTEREIPTSIGRIGKGLDVKGENSSIILPTPGSRYTWDPHWGIDTAPLAPAPAWLTPPLPERLPEPRPPPKRLNRSYGAGALASAHERIRNAPDGQQEAVLNAECLAVGTLAAIDRVNVAEALATLLDAARHMPDYDRNRPWRERDIDRKVRHAFADGLRKPRGISHG
jgi:hypothetical protein